MPNHASAEIRQAPGWWPSLVQVVCDECGYRGPVRDLNAKANAVTLARIERGTHRCGEDPFDAGEEW